MTGLFTFAKALAVLLWQRWRALSARRRWQIRLTVVVLSAAAILFLRASPRAPVGRSTRVDAPDSSSRGRRLLRRSPPSTSMPTRATPADFLAAQQVQHAGEWLLFASNPVVVRGDLDEWDGFKVGSPVVMKDGASRYRMWYRGCHFVTGDYRCGVGHASSDDGVVWQKSPQPVFQSEQPSESERLGGISIVRDGDRYFMWYAVTADWFADPPRHYATINLATSSDGLHWQNAGEVLRTVRSSMVDIEPAAFFDGALFHLWFTDLSTTDQQKILVHEISSDGKQWRLAGATAIAAIRIDPGRLGVMSDGHGGYRALVTNVATDRRAPAVLFGLLASADGSDWTAVEDPYGAPRALLERSRVADSPAVLADQSGLWVWFVTRPPDGADAIDLIYRKGGAS